MMKTSKKMKHNRWLGAVIAAASITLGFLTNACGGESGGEGRDPKPSTVDAHFTGDSRNSVKLYLSGEEGEKRLLKFSPQNAAHALAENPSLREDDRGSSSAAASPIRASRQEIRVDGQTPAGQAVPAQELPSLHVLTDWVYEDCGDQWFESQHQRDENVAWPRTVGGGREPATARLKHPLAYQEPWFESDGAAFVNYYIARVKEDISGQFVHPSGDANVQNVAGSCDDVIALQSQFLCVAGRFAEIAGAVSSVRLGLHTVPGESSPWEILIPPQSQSDRYLLRQMALESLAAFAQLDMERVGPAGSPVGDECGDMLSKALTNPTLYSGATYSQHFFDWNGYVPFAGMERNPSTPSAFSLAVSQRATLYLRQHEAALGLLENILTSGTYEAIGQAEMLREEGGLALMWGEDRDLVETNGNSLRGAAATLLGRLEVDTVAVGGDASPMVGGSVSAYLATHDPKCAGVARLRDFPEEDDLFDVSSAVHRARVADVPPSTLEQQRAQSIVERLGIVLHSDHIVPGQLLPMIRQQMAIDDLFDPGGLDSYTKMSATDPATGNSYLEGIVGSHGRAYDAILEGISEEDIVFALRTNLSLYVQLSGGRKTSFPPSEINSGAGLTRFGSLVGPLLNSMADGASLRRAIISQSATQPDGIGRDALIGDIFPRMGAAAAASQCSRNELDTPLHEPYQDVGMLAETLHRGVRRIFSAWEPSETDELGSLGAAISSQYLNQHALGGISRIEMYPWSVDGAWALVLSGSAALGGVDSLGELPISIIWGRSWEAECVAGTRTLCGENFKPEQRLQHVETVSDQKDVPLGAPDRYLGVFQPTSVADDTSGNLAIETVPPFVNLGSGQRLFYVILEPSASAPGTVLGAIKPVEGTLSTAIAPSKLQRQLLNDVFEVSAARTPGDKCVEGVSSAVLANYCVPGLAKDQYVPLSNELTDDVGGGAESSWRHYLGLAQQAAVLADDLGQRIIELGTTRDLRSETALDHLSNLCGTVTGEDLAVGRDGVVETASDAELSACIDPPTVPVVFFEGDAASLDDDELVAREAAVRVVLGCDDPDASVDGLAACEPWGPSSVVGLGMDPPPARDNPTAPEGCRELLGLDGNETQALSRLIAFDSLDREWFAGSVLKEQYSPTSLASALSKYQFVEGRNGEWVLYLNGGQAVLAGRHEEVGTQVDTITLDYSSEFGRQHTAFPLCERVVVTGAPGPQDPEETVTIPRGESCSSRSIMIARALGFEVHDEGVPHTSHAPADPPVSVPLIGGSVHHFLSWQEVEAKVRRTAEGALYHMARLTGNMPKGLFSLLVPAFNYDAPGVSDDEVIEWSALYAEGGYVSVPNTSNAFRMNPAQVVFARDADFMGTLYPMPLWQKQFRGKIGLLENDETYPRGRFYRKSFANPDMAGFLVMEVQNASRFLGGGIDDYGTEYNLEELGVAQWLNEVLKGGGDAEEAFDASTEQLNWGNSPKGTNLLEDGILKSVVIRRFEDCEKGTQRDRDQDLIWGKMGDLLPYDGSVNEDPVTIWRTLCDEDGADDRDCLRYTTFSEYGTCSANGGGEVSCTPGDANWRELSNGGVDYTSPDGEVWNMEKYDQFDCDVEKFADYTSVLMSPTVWPPEQRAYMYVDPGPGPGHVLGGLGLLSCLAEGTIGDGSLEVPVIRDVREIPALRSWIDLQADLLRERQKSMFLTDLPEEVVGFYRHEGLQVAVGGGESADQMFAAAQGLQEIHDGFSAVYSGVRAMADAVRDAELSLTAAEIREDQAAAELAIRRVNAIGSIAASTALAASSATAAYFSAVTLQGAQAANNTGAAAASAINALTAAATLPYLGDLEALNGAEFDNSVSQVLQGMTEAVQRGMEQAEGGMSQITTGQLAVLRAQNSLKSTQANAAREAARASGADGIDFDGDGQIDSELPVNIVYRRQNDVLLQRYEQALESAKRYAYLARLSIEQKLGVRMESLTDALGPLPAPATWVNDVCSLTGIDYADLRTLDSDALGTSENISEEEIIDDFADRYIGDYVRRLEEFVEFYNVQYPFHEEDDVAVLSVRDDLVYGNGACRRQARNMLYQSDRLATPPPAPENLENEELSLGGWKKTPCRLIDEEPLSGECLYAQDNAVTYENQNGDLVTSVAYGIDSASTQEIAAPSLSTGLTVLAGRPMEVVVGEEERAVGDLISDIRPSAAVYQSVFLDGGTFYFLSWKDMARDAFGTPTSETAEYRVIVANEEWSPIYIEDFDAVPSAGTTSPWSARRKGDVYVEEDGFYHVVFQPLFDFSSRALALSSVQLELAEFEGLGDYEATAETRTINAFDCGAGNPQLFRESFERRCSQGECYYELTKPVQLSDRDIDDGRWGLPGVAQNNYNYRHLGIALNMVGSGVLDCSGASDGCYSQGFVEYDLVHSAYNTALRDYGDEARCFNFGQGHMSHAKALAAERFLGVPMSSDDSALIGGPEFTKEAFAGRPLTGLYTLRIHETPRLRWENVEDVQLVLNYRYWSRVSTGLN